MQKLINKTKQFTVKLLRPFARQIFWLYNFKLLGKPTINNKYSRKIPILMSIFEKIDNFLILVNSKQQRSTEYSKWVKRNYPTQNVLNLQKEQAQKLKNKPLISVIVPTYNTNIKQLKTCIDSVLQQNYSNWELCIADDASTDEQVRDVITIYAEQDDRIKFKFRNNNGHICKASNTALSLAKGEYVSLLDHDDVLWPNALFEVVKEINRHPKAKFIYSDEDKISEDGKIHSDPFFKPDWSPEFLRSINYITHFSTIDSSLVNKLGGFRPGYEGAQDWDLFLRVSRETDEIYHVPTILYSWRKSENSTAQQASAKTYAYDNQKKALLDDVKQRGMNAKINWQIPFSMWRLDYKLVEKSLVSIIIPTKDQYNYIRRCLKSIHEKTKYTNFEVVIVDTGSTDERVWKLYDEYQNIFEKFKILKWEELFNFAAVCDYGAKLASGKYFLFLNNDTEVISHSWIEDMLGYAQQKDIGAVGCKLLYPDGKLQHAGIILGVGGRDGTPGVAGHFFPGFIENPPQDSMLQLYVGGTRDFTAVTAACVMVSKEKFERVKGFDKDFRIAFNDVDFCLKLYTLGLRNVYLPHVQLFHFESVSVGQPGSKVRDLKEFSKEINMMIRRWKPLIENDPYYHKEFRRDIASARLKD
ncbi:MAG: glycosyltransferase family 2 protein [bacterium]|nr:glycosyltransferase family 2 protein [bacterium]